MNARSMADHEKDQTPNYESHLRVMPGVESAERAPVVVKKRRRLSAAEHIDGVLKRDRAIIGRTFSLMESANPNHHAVANAVMTELLPLSGKSIRLGITGSPGVGKSTFIEALGLTLVGKGHRVAVLTVDPSSELSGGSILGDKTRMENLAREPRALIRPSSCGGMLGGVARGTRESIIVCEAAGYDVIIVETVGVGQSETQVSSMVDFFLFLAIAGAGDELQGIKRGILELVDTIAITKADGENEHRADATRGTYLGVLKLFRQNVTGWTPRVLACSAITGRGIDEVWRAVTDHRRLLDETGKLEERRRRQSLSWMKQMVEYQVVERFYRRPGLKDRLTELQEQVAQGALPPSAAAEKLLVEFEGLGAPEAPQ